jgi:CRP/FNR family transcriptional regulator, cyclic AMP receptor protein
MSPLSNDVKQQLLTKVEFFSGCTERQLRDVAHLTGEERIPAGADLCRQDAFEDNVFVIVEGEADVIIDGSSVGKSTVGEIVGELSMLGSGKRAATLRAVTSMHVLVLDPREIDSVLSADPSSARRLSQHGGQASS